MLPALDTRLVPDLPRLVAFYTNSLRYYREPEDRRQSETQGLVLTNPHLAC